MAMYCKGHVWSSLRSGQGYVIRPHLWPWLLVIGAWALPGLGLAEALGIVQAGVLLHVAGLPVGPLLCLLGLACGSLGVISARDHLHGGVLLLCILALSVSLLLLLLAGCRWPCA